MKVDTSRYSFEYISKERYIYRDPNSGCWIWLGRTWHTGYGVIRHCGKSVAAHRYMYALYNGEFHDDMDVLHICDVRSCVNPNHLRLGTHSDNMKDMYKKGRRSQKGENNGGAKLTLGQVREIRSLYKEGNLSQAEIGRMYNVTQVNVGLIVRNKFWNEDF